MTALSTKTQTTLRVRRSDLDVNGHVNNGTYQSFFEEARIEAMPLLKEADERLAGDFEIARCELEFRKELKYPDEAIVATELLTDERGRFLSQEILRGSDSAVVTQGRFYLRDAAAPQIYYREEDYPHAVYHSIDVAWPHMTPEARVGLHTIQYYLDDARIRSGYATGLDIDSLQEQGIGPVVYRAEIDYFAPMTFRDELVIATVYERGEKGRLAFRHDLFSKSSRRLLLRSLVHGLFMDLKRMRPYRFSDEQLERIMSVNMKSPFRDDAASER